MDQLKIAKTGALCCAAAGPHGEKSYSVSRDCSMDPGEPHWRTNSSFSPSLSRRWEHRVHSDRLLHGNCRAPIYGSSMSSQRKRTRRGVNSDRRCHQLPNHHHSVSDGALSYHGSPSDSFPPLHWTSPVRFDLGEFSTPARGPRPGPSVFSQANEGHFPGGTSFVSASPFSESSQWASSNKQPIFFLPRNFSGRRSFISKPVYPLVFRNPVSDFEASETASTNIGGNMAPDDSNRTSPQSTLSPDMKFHKALTELQQMEGSPEPGIGSRREGFRWSNASSYYDYGFDGDAIDITEHISVEKLRSHNNSATCQKCALCERFLWQKSPWNSYRIVRNGDLPIAGVLPCSHVFHAECLEETTPENQVHEPPCPLCLKTDGACGYASFSHHLQTAHRSVQSNQGFKISNVVGSSSSANQDQSEVDVRQNRSLPISRRGRPLIKDHFKKQFSFKGRIGKDLFSSKVFGRNASLPSFSSMQDHH